MNIHFFVPTELFLIGYTFLQTFQICSISKISEINPTDCIVIRSSFLAMTVKTNPHPQNSEASLSNLVLLPLRVLWQNCAFVSRPTSSGNSVVYIPKSIDFNLRSASSEPSNNIPKPPLYFSPTNSSIVNRNPVAPRKLSPIIMNRHICCKTASVINIRRFSVKGRSVPETYRDDLSQNYWSNFFIF